jgi:ubiquinone/menaquinone biosynthesis C-methylase UbiE
MLRAVTATVVCAWPHQLLARHQDRDAGRERWQRVPDLLDAMRMRDGAHVADVGAGGGFITRRLAAQVGPAGRVYAVEIEPRIVARLRQRLQDDGLANVDVVLGSSTDPGLPPDSLDAIIVVDAYHEFTEPAAMLQAFRRALRRDARLVICDSVSSLPTRDEQVKWHSIAPRFITAELEAAGFRVLSVDEAFTTRGSTRKALIVAER